MKKILIALTIVFATATVTGCNTVHGLGKDVKRVGEKMSGEK